MKFAPALAFCVLGLFAGTSPAAAQEPVPMSAADSAPAEAAPQEVVASAVAAVKALGERVVLGHYDEAVKRMNPQWKKRVASRAGGIESLERQLARVAEEMTRRGITMMDFKPQGPPRSIEVWPGKQVSSDGGKQVEELVYTKWMVFVPTLTRFRVWPEGEKTPVIVESTGFQIAISDKGSDEWTFIDGSGVSMNELRQLFITLPADLELPPISQREVK